MVAKLAPTMSAHMATTTLKVDGMTCGACTSAVEAGFKDVDGAGSVTVSLIMGRAVVHHDPAKLSPAQIAEIIEDRGFDAEVLTTDMPNTGPKLSLQTSSTPPTSITTLKVDGMTCGACTSSVEAGFKDVEGVKSISVSLLAGRAVIEHDAGIIAPEKLAETIEDRGFDAEVLDTKKQSQVGQSGPAEPTQISDVYTTTVSIDGMTCGACTSAVEGGFKNRPGIVKFNISLLAGRAVISHKSQEISADQIVETIEDSGFDAKLLSSEPEGLQMQSSSTVQLKIYGLADATSATEIENLLREKDGVKSAVVSLATSRANIRYDPATTGLRTIVETIENAGYNALVADSDDNNAQLESLAKTKEIHEWRRAFLTSLSFAVPVFLISMIIPMFIPVLNFGKTMIIPGLFLGDVVCCALTVPVQFGIGKRFYISAYKSIKHGSPTMDVLVVLGTSAAFFFSCFAVVIAVLIPPHNRPSTLFDTSTMLFTFITLGRWLENRAKGQTSKALSNLMSLAPSMATIYEDPLYAEKLAEDWESPSSPILEKSGNYSDAQHAATNEAAVEKIIPTELIEVGDVVLLRPGDKVPADGVVTRGESYVDESMVTGEPVPILKKKNQALIAGTVNGAGRLDFRVTRAGKDTQLSQIVNLVQEAQTSRAPIQRMADLVAGYFVPVIVLLGLITFVGWMILSHALPHPPEIFSAPQSGGKFMICLKLCISVIVFACPCALGLATPTAVMVGTGTASQQGILVKGGAALETATRITHLIFDKTGTLTFGKLKVSKVTIQGIWNVSEEARKTWWAVVGLAESGSEHPIGRSITLRAKEQLGIALEDPLPGHVGQFENRVGKGIVAQIEVQLNGQVQRHEARIGNASFLEAHGLDVPSDLKPENSKSLAGLTLIYIAIDNKFTGVLGLSDTVKPTAAAAVTALHRMGISTSLVTGDTYSTAVAIADLVGIPKDTIRASVSPGQKQEIVAELQAQGEIVAMVGDGINDSPALATANVGIGLVSGSDIAVEAADVVIMRSDDMLNVPAALCLCRTIFNRIKANLLWACGYNVVGLPFAMGLFLPFGYYMPPLASAIAMMFSSISVTLSSLALRWSSRPRWLNAERLEMESEKIAVPRMGQPRVSRGALSSFSQRVWAMFDTNLGGLKRRRAGDTGDRGNYVPLRSAGDV